MEASSRRSKVRFAGRAPALPGVVLGLVAAAVGILLPGEALPGEALPAETPAEPGSPEGVWITLGGDAFETLRGAGVSFRSRPLERAAERHAPAGPGVVLTRVAAGDLERVSALLHAAHGRCPGFMVHRDEGRGLEALARSSGPVGQGAPVYTLDQPAMVQTLQAQVEESDILGTIEHLSTAYDNRYYSHPSGSAAAAWIRDLWQGFATARPEVAVELYEHAGWSQPSVVLTIPGASLPEEVVVLGGHLDSTASGSGNPSFLAPGADDNASGIAALGEAVRVALAAGLRPRRTVQVIAYAAEEVGLRGSQDIAESYRDAGVDVVAVLQLDLTAYQGSAQDVAFLDDFTNTALTSFLGQLLDAYQSDLAWTMTTCGYACSDHASWHLEGFPAAMPAESRFGEHNPTIHTTSDTTATFGNSAAHAAKFARLAAAFMVEAAKHQEPDPLFSDGFEAGSAAAWTLSEPASP